MPAISASGAADACTVPGAGSAPVLLPLESVGAEGPVYPRRAPGCHHGSAGFLPRGEGWGRCVGCLFCGRGSGVPD